MLLAVVAEMTERFAKLDKRLQALSGWFSPRFRLSSVPTAVLISTASLLPILLFGGEVHPLPQSASKYLAKFARMSLRAYYCDRISDMLAFLGWPSLELAQQKRLLLFSARALGSAVPLIRNTALSVLQHHKHLPWSTRVHQATTQWKLDRELAKAFKACKAAGLQNLAQA